MVKQTKSKKINIMFAFVILLITMISSSFAAAGGLNVVLSNQNPDPVSPGNYVYLNVKLSNVDSGDLNDVSISFVENKNFKLASGEETTKKVGTIGAYSSTNSDGFVIAKYKVFVSENTPSGLNKVTFKSSVGSSTFTYDFDVLVQDSNPQIKIADIQIPQVKAGDIATLKLTLENTNSINLKNVKVALDLANVDDKVINLNKGSNELVLNNIEASEKKDLEYEVIISPSAESKPYLLPIKITYDDNLDNSFENTIYGTVKVYSEPELSFELDSQEIYTIGQGKFILAIANPGSSKIRGVQMKILPSEDYEIIEGENQYVGDLNPDDFQTLQGQVYIKNAEQATLKVELTYGDSYDVRDKKIVEVPLKIYNNEQLIELGFKTKASSSGFTGYLIAMLLSAGLTFYFVRRHFKKKITKRN